MRSGRVPMSQIEGTRGAESLLDGLGKGRPLRADVARALASLVGVPIGRDGLSRFFQPGFPGVRTYAVEARAEADQSIDLTIVAIARDGAPAWTGPRSFLRGRDGSLEIHHGFQEVDPAYRSRNLIVDAIRRELSLLLTVDSGPSARITVDAEGAGCYLCALHGFVFADETEEGPPARSLRARDPSSDRERLAEAAPPFVAKLAARHQIDLGASERARHELASATAPWAFARVELAGAPLEVPEVERGLAGGLGRAFLLAEDTPSWRAALYARALDPKAHEIGEEFRQRQTARAEMRLAEAINTAREQLNSSQRSARIKALETLQELGPQWMLSEVRALTEDPDRRVATVARQTVRAMSSADIAEQILAFAQDRTRSPRLRGLSYRVLAEYYPAQIAPHVAMLRVNPDARIQRAVIPYIAESGAEPGPELASMLAANPWNETPNPRPGLAELRVELIERLALRPDARTLPPLLAAVSAYPPPPPGEMLALTRALVAYPDPRARVALSAATQRLDRPPVP